MLHRRTITAQYSEPSGGCLLPLLAVISFFSPTKMFSIVVVFFHCLIIAKFYTWPVFWLTEGMLILVLKLTFGGFSG